MAHTYIGFATYDLREDLSATVARAAEALESLDAPAANRRAEGLKILAQIGDPDLFDWCAVCLDDRSVTVRVAALRAMLKCSDGTVEVIQPLAKDNDRRVRAAAVAALARFAGNDAPRWIEYGLRDPEPCVRTAATRCLRQLDRRRHHRALQLASHDPNEDIAAKGRKRLHAKKHR